jgi:hypothetical protein
MFGDFPDSDRKVEEVRSLKLNADLLRVWITDNFEECPGHDQPTSEIFRMIKHEIDFGHLPKIGLREALKEIEAVFPKAMRPTNPVHLPSGDRARVVRNVAVRK